MPMLHAPKYDQPQVMAEMRDACEELTGAIRRMTARAQVGNYAEARDHLAIVRAYVKLLEDNAGILRGEWADQ